MAIIQLTSREFRDNQASVFALADKGEKIVINRRGKQSYMLTPVSDEDFILSPELEKRIEEGRKEFREGKTISCKTKEELQDFLNSL